MIWGMTKLFNPLNQKENIFSINDVDLNRFSTFIKGGGDLKDFKVIKPKTFKAEIIQTNFISHVIQFSKATIFK